MPSPAHPARGRERFDLSNDTVDHLANDVAPPCGRLFSPRREAGGIVGLRQPPPRPLFEGPVAARGMHMRVDRGRLNWGVFFLVLGAVPLAYQQGAVSILGDAWRLWPLVLVGIGLAFILSRTRAYFVGGTVVAITLGLVFGSVLATGPNIGCGGNGNGSNSASQSGSFGTASTIELDLQCGSVNVSTSTDQQWHVTTTNSGGSAAQVSSTAGSLRVGSAASSGWSFTRSKDD